MKEGEKNTDKALKEILNENDFPFVKDYKVFRTLGLKPLETAILNEILSFNMHGQEYTGSFTYIQKEFNVSKDTAIRALKKLVNDGYLIKNASKGGNTSIYSINELKIKSLFLNSRKIRELEEQTVANLEGKPSQNQTVNSRKIGHNKNIYKNNNKNIYIDAGANVDLKKEDDTSNTKKEADTKVSTTQKKKKPLLSNKQENLFAQFWEIYPKKDDIIPAKKAWNKIKPDTDLFNQILYGAKMYAKEKANTDKQYVKKANNWLKDEAWRNYTENKEAAGNNLPPKDEPSKKPYWQEPYATF